MTKQTKFILAIALQVVIIFAIIIFKLSVLTSGTEVMLRIAPVDPRDLLRGDYATFQYDISNLESYYSRGEQIRNGDTVYVVLRQSGKCWIAQNVQKNKPIRNKLFIKGKVDSGGTESQTDQFSYQRFGGSRLHIVYGIEQYFIPEGKGQIFSFWNKKAVAMVAIDDNGNAALKKIYVDDKHWP
ncbi:MAG: GDYXXLXY domain-containing protein [Nitrospirae bacterium]|nr:GDYXXLXY domain-containing protein [Nitrospirota bacterium]MBF0534346.1 GDYXXLXY domain-containing protein [Nitrospirota bacterium]MBF0615673.1 GDYXXLXY domain-containing protein [Nitrospirota bacterium]